MLSLQNIEHAGQLEIIQAPNKSLLKDKIYQKGRGKAVLKSEQATFPNENLGEVVPVKATLLTTEFINTLLDLVPLSERAPYSQNPSQQLVLVDKVFKQLLSDESLTNAMQALIKKNLL